MKNALLLSSMFGLVLLSAGRLFAQEATPLDAFREKLRAEWARDGGFSSWVFGERGPEDARRRLHLLLAARLEAIDFVCGLTPDQKQQLERLGKGDVQRLFDEIDGLAAEIQAFKSDRQRVIAFQRKHQALQGRVRFGPRGPDTLMVKSVEQILTADQLTRYGPLGDVLRSGGTAKMMSTYGEPGLALELADQSIGDAELSRIATLPRIRLLVLRSTKVTDAGIAALPASDDLWSLDLRLTAVTDAGLVGLGGFKGLRSLDLRNTATTDASLEGVGKLRHLTYLSLADTKVSDAGLAHLHDLTQLKLLDLGGTQVTGEGLRHLSDVTALDYLILINSPVTDTGLHHLRPFKRLTHLNLEGTKVTDVGLRELIELRELGPLWLERTDVTPKGAAELEAALPKVNINGNRLR